MLSSLRCSCATPRPPHVRASRRAGSVAAFGTVVKGCPTIGTMEPEEDTERIAKLREQRRADRERRRRAHQQAQAVASDERQAQADERRRRPRKQSKGTRSPSRAPSPRRSTRSSSWTSRPSPPPSPPLSAPQEERYPDVDAELLGEEIRRERTRSTVLTARRRSALLAEAERGQAEASAWRPRSSRTTTTEAPTAAGAPLP